jgi:CubicO group peptidase (beta-lactamase class C family)
MPNLTLDRRHFVAGGAALLAGLSSGPVRAATVASLNVALEAIRTRHRLPGVAALVFRNGRIAAQGVVGRRVATTGDRIRLSDPFVIGSCGKSMTATIVARLVARGVVSFGTTLGAVFPELRSRMQAGYRTVSVAALLAHRSGLPDLLPVPLPVSGNPAADRARALPFILALPPEGMPGQTYRYSNLGYIVVGAVLERLVGVAFERLAARELFQPLSLGSAGFFAPTGPSAPRGHTFMGVPLSPGSLLYPPRAGSPAGLFHLSLPDWARYARVHLGLGPQGYLSSTLLARLQRPSSGPGERYAFGWHVTSTEAGIRLSHNGSDGYWAARILLIPSRDYGILMATNILSTGADSAGDELQTLLLRRFPPA